MKTTAFQKNLSALLAKHGTYSAIARKLQVQPRTFRSQRATPSQKSIRIVAQEARTVRLRECLKTLHTECGVPLSTLRQAMRLVMHHQESAPSDFS